LNPQEQVANRDMHTIQIDLDDLDAVRGLG